MHNHGLHGAKPRMARITVLLVALLVTSYALLVTDCYPEEETITITTYYPSPYGSYNELRTNRMAVGYLERSEACWDPEGGVCPGTGTNIIDDPYATPPRNIDLIVNGTAGIGTTNPQGMLHIFKDTGKSELRIESGADAWEDPILTFYTGHSPSAWGNGQIMFYNTYNEYISEDDDRRIIAVMQVLGAGNSTNKGGEIRFLTKQDGVSGTVGNQNERLRITNTGDIGIGTATPGAKLGIVNDFDNPPAGGMGRKVVSVSGMNVNDWNYTWLSGSHGLNEQFYVKPPGDGFFNRRVGINTAPSDDANLAINGNIKTTGDICTDVDGGKCLSAAKILLYALANTAEIDTGCYMATMAQYLADEKKVVIPVPAGKLKHLRLSTATNVPSGSVLQVTMRKNLADADLTCTVPVGSKSCENLADSVSVAEGDLVCFKIRNTTSDPNVVASVQLQ